MVNVEVSFPSELSFGIRFFIYLHLPGDSAVSPSLLPRKEVVVGVAVRMAVRYTNWQSRCSL